jgi:hypothetical protein
MDGYRTLMVEEEGQAPCEHLLLFRRERFGFGCYACRWGCGATAFLVPEDRFDELLASIRRDPGYVSVSSVNVKTRNN